MYLVHKNSALQKALGARQISANDAAPYQPNAVKLSQNFIT